MNIKKEKYDKVNSLIEQLSQKRLFKKAIDLAKHYKVKGVLITRRTIKEQYGLTNKQIEKLQVVEVDNPYYKCAGNMRLYLITQVEYVSSKKTRKLAIQGALIDN